MSLNIFSFSYECHVVRSKWHDNSMWHLKKWKMSWICPTWQLTPIRTYLDQKLDGEGMSEPNFKLRVYLDLFEYIRGIFDLFPYYIRIMKKRTKKWIGKNIRNWLTDANWTWGNIVYIVMGEYVSLENLVW